ncbi:hypothetical protein BAUCODRAFT_129467 [Baudoinia panamericana UAMH 10762]|uniref:tRNA pseudouridine synthase 1 n=1 Tax=Baudoinia panamericana (strain UAMH 10762) TaxID=717646 RepID=M2LX45_BAUPA|nr:uncharacterized protein BAUCODRAFT_129467 [Baudoinia panamericana UAMH 10762]EMC99262.1 hypothetical protein BAUCODRAFT_129467 [Baudoinia panamericana UAMH 10762]
MDHSTAILEDARKVVENAGGEPARPTVDAGEQPSKPTSNEAAHDGDEGRQNNYSRRKRKADYPDARQQYGSKGGHDDNKRHKKGDLGRGEYFSTDSLTLSRDNPDKRAKTNESREKRMANGETRNNPNYGATFSKEEIDAESRRPKRKVAVLIGYSGTGYKGMQITPSERTIEGDLFAAFIRAGAISKANAEDPKKVSLVRCARTDKGVHAAGNMISLKLIVEDEDIVERINKELSPQIRVWGVERTVGSFSCYQACDSRWYEYLIPSHAFLPPHPGSWLGRKLEEHADEVGDREAYEGRQEEVKRFWERVDADEISRVLQTIDEDIRAEVVKALQGEDEAVATTGAADVEEGEQRVVKAAVTESDANDADVGAEERTEEAAIIINAPAAQNQPDDAVTDASKTAEAGNATARAGDAEPMPDTMVDSAISLPPQQPPTSAIEPNDSAKADQPTLAPASHDRQTRLRAATKSLRAAYITAKRRYRIPTQRIARIQAALDKFVGTHNYHNYTVQKTYRDPSAKRHIKSFVVNPKPILIGEGDDEADKSEWLSLKVHGQSFMMHQIRKMIGMVTLLVRCGSNLDTLSHSFGEDKYSIPKVPGLGLLLERPVFDSYNNIQAAKHDRPPLLFGKFEREMEEFKQREIYQRIFREEEERNEFGRFFAHVDNFKEGYFLYVTSKGLEGTKGGGVEGGKSKAVEDDEDGASGGDDQ